MKKAVKTTAMLLCAAMLAALPASCSKNDGSGGSGSAPDGPITFPYTGDPIVFKGYAYEGLDQNPDLLCQKAWKEHIGNISIEYEFAPYSDYAEKANVYLASGEIPDVLPYGGVMSAINEYASTGMFLDFNKYADYMPNLQEYRKQYASMDYVLKDGARYAIIGVQPIDWSGEGWFVNMDVLKEADQEVPSTFDEFVAVMRAVKAKNPDIVPYQSYWNIGYAQGTIAKSMGAQPNMVYFDTADNKYKFSYREASARRKELIETMAAFYKEGLINSEIQTMSFEQELNALASGNWAFSFTYLNSPEKEYFKLDPGEKAPFDIQPMTPPADADGNRYLSIAYAHDGLPGWGILCSSKVKNPEYLAAYMDQVVSPFGRDIFNYGVEGETYEVKDGKYQYLNDAEAKKAEYGIGTQYEVWMVGMGPTDRSEPVRILKESGNQLNTKNFLDGTVKAWFDPAFVTFSTEVGEEKASLENALTTYIEENEAKFIYGLRDLSEWDAYVEEIEKIADIDHLLELYNSAEITVREPERIFEVK